jgi:cobalt-zinc-cadmium efflux system outer membrane protein
LLHDAITTRPDLKGIALQRERSAAALRLAKRVRIPDLALQVGVSVAGVGGGQDSGSTVPPTLLVGVSGSIPVFYQQQGEIKKAQADVSTQSLQEAKLEAQVASDVDVAFTNFTATSELVQRMDNRLLDRAKRARDLVAVQYQKGAASLLEYLDAQRTYISTNVEYIQDLTNYWIAVYQMEQAVGRELR